MKMVTDKELAELIFPEVKDTLEDLEKKYPVRDLPNGAEVTRFAPSPTGFLHLGSLFTSMICKKVASQSSGVFFVRLEDTDTKREIQGSGKMLLDQLHIFGVDPDEGYLGDHEKGNYGPYKQSDRAYIYKVGIKHLLENGRAYPCFCSTEELDQIRAIQEKAKLIPGYYGQFAKCRFLTNDERAERIKRGDPYVIRFKSNGNHIRKIRVKDLVRGEFDIAQNDQDIVIFKSDGLPTYHFAHCMDDHLMRTTTVIRGEEWIASLPIHVELFEAMGWKAPNYCHVPVIMKLDEEGHKRKLSKRLDKEAAVSYFIEDGFPPESVIMYLMTIANSNFEEWILANKFSNMQDFTFNFQKMSHEGALFDIGKLSFFSKEILAKMKIDDIYEFSYNYAMNYNEKLFALINKNPEYFKSILNIERDKDNPRKDYDKLGNLAESIAFFYNDSYKEILEKDGLCFNPKFDNSTIINVLKAVEEKLDINQDEQSWFNNMKEIGESLMFAPSGKIFKQNPDQYIGSVSDVAEMLRITLTTKKNSPNLYYVMRVLSKEECNKRIEYVISLLNK